MYMYATISTVCVGGGGIKKQKSSICSKSLEFKILSIALCLNVEKLGGVLATLKEGNVIFDDRSGGRTIYA